MTRKSRKHKSFLVFDNFMIFFGTFRKLDGPKAPDDYSNHAVRPLKEDFFLRMSQRSGKSKTFSKIGFCRKFSKFGLLKETKANKRNKE